MEKYKKLSVLLSVLTTALIIVVIVLSVLVDKYRHSSKNKGGGTKIIINEKVFGHLENGEKVMKYTLRNKNDFEINLISYGAAIQSIFIKDKSQNLTNIVLGFDTLNEYTNPKLNPYFGSIVGRVANRIAKAQFTLDGKVYHLDKNDGENTLHGGFNGFSWRNWHPVILDDGVKFSLESKDGEDGFPGTVITEVYYRLNNNTNTLLIEYAANTTSPTPIDLTNHAYFNLAGHNSSEKIYNQYLKIFSDYYLDVNFDDLIPSGRFNSVSESKYDFRNYTRLGDRVAYEAAWPQEGFDNFFISNQQTGNKIIASVKNPSNGLQLDIWSNQNGVQFYTSNFLNLSKSSGETYSRHAGFCLETQNLPDAVNHPFFTSSILRPEGKYLQRTIYSFKVKR